MIHPYLRNVRFDKPFKIDHEVFVHNYFDLANEIKYLDDSQFRKFVHPINKIVDWINTNYGDKKLVKRLRGIDNKDNFIAIIQDRITELEKERQPILL